MSNSHQKNMSVSKRSGIFVAILFVILGAVCLVGPQAQATFIASIEQVGADVVASGSGAIDLAGLSLDGTGSSTAAIIPNAGLLNLTTGSPNVYSGLSGPTSFGSGGPTVASSSSGDLVGILGFFPANLFLPQNYASGNPLSATSTYNNATFATLGVTPGIYTWTWGTGMHADSFSIYAGVPVPGVPDTGSTLMLLLIAAGLMFLATCRSRRLISIH